ncbi:DUF6625 family protein [Lactobacillus delbrueckii subsp. bulgaricus]|nr:hypothetical protein [Lactobacillus delbrueckii subsp. bulgaricus]MBT8887293.1 hypothetical protein [Lactobacillus delbrueckii subsp. bulgaricus]MBT8888838.1 hypothetical protein [Lactobacillus delbrueckii subsp. bulgaricus]MBT9029826.1 hypothetical protein [Lactobacillus delbrueckii subsp. bulgaricus]
MKAKVVLIIPYFGTFPNYFEYWLKSAEKNSAFDFLIFTDNVKYESVNNIKYVYCTFEEFKAKLQSCVEFKIVLDRPYKICDYRPLYGTALQDYIREYDFWGFCDVDLIFGNIGKYVTDDILSKYDKIYELGHFTLLRNNKQCNDLWKMKHHIHGAYRYDEAFRTPYSCHFDETDGLTPISESQNIRTYVSLDFADIDYRQYNFSVLGAEYKAEKSLFVWENGSLYHYYMIGDEIKRREYIYAHFQKRRMEISKDLKPKREFCMVPNSFCEMGNVEQLLSQVKVREEYPYYTLKRKKELKEKFRTHAIQQRLYRLLFRNVYRLLLDRM